MAFDTKSYNNDSSSDLFGLYNNYIKENPKINFMEFVKIRLYKLNTHSFQLIGDKWTIVGCVIIALREGLTVEKESILKAIEYTKEIIKDFNGDNTMDWFKDEVKEKDFIKTLNLLNHFI